MKVGDLVLWRTARSYQDIADKEVFGLVIDLPTDLRGLWKGKVAKIMTCDRKLYIIPLYSHYVLEVINEED